MATVQMKSEYPSTWLTTLSWVRKLPEAKHDEAVKWLVENGDDLPLCDGEPPRRGAARFRQAHDGTADVKWVGQDPPKRVQREKLLARALWNSSNGYAPAVGDSGGLLGKILDYEVPLKPRGGGYPGLGKIDILSAGSAREPVIIELKIGTKSPLEGIIEAYFYTRILRDEMNLKALGDQYSELDVKACWRMLLVAPDEVLAKSTEPLFALTRWCEKQVSAVFTLAKIGSVKSVRDILDHVVASCRSNRRPMLSPDCCLKVISSVESMGRSRKGVAS